MKERTDEWDGTWSLVTRVAWFDAADGQILFSLDLREAMPEALIEIVKPWQQGLLVVDTDNRITALTEEGGVLWKASPKGTLANSFAHVYPAVRYDDDLLFCEVYSLNPGLDNSNRLVVIDDTGKVLLDLGGLSRVHRAASVQRAIAVGNDPKTMETKYAYVIDLTERSVEVSRARIPSFSGSALSPSGEFLALVRPVSEAECIVSVYRFEGVE